jgi:ribosomal protein S18 acetylase RimI-like enzyme
LAIRIADADDLPSIERLDALSASPTRHIHRDMEKYFGSVDPSTHERTIIFLGETLTAVVAKAELMLPAQETLQAVGYVKRVVVDPAYRKQGIARRLMEHIIRAAHTDYHLNALDLHTWEHNTSAIRLYEALGFELQHRELYFRLTL